MKKKKFSINDDNGKYGLLDFSYGLLHFQFPSRTEKLLIAWELFPEAFFGNSATRVGISYFNTTFDDKTVLGNFKNKTNLNPNWTEFSVKGGYFDWSGLEHKVRIFFGVDSKRFLSINIQSTFEIFDGTYFIKSNLNDDLYVKAWQDPWELRLDYLNIEFKEYYAFQVKRTSLPGRYNIRNIAQDRYLFGYLFNDYYHVDLRIMTSGNVTDDRFQWELIRRSENFYVMRNLNTNAYLDTLACRDIDFIPKFQCAVNTKLMLFQSPTEDPKTRMLRFIPVR